ncbi:hypothetical protein ACFLZ2_06205, partial [Candidatus Margulisiibacteriota bacterium]
MTFAKFIGKVRVVMWKITLLSIIILLVLSSGAFSETRPWRTFSGGIGNVAGMPAYMGTIRSQAFSEHMYFSLGFAYADNQGLNPAPIDLRNMTVAFLDANVYLWGDVYLGLGINYPMAITGGDTPLMGYQAVLGTELPWNFYAEAGYSELRRTTGGPFYGVQAMLGFRIVLSEPEDDRVEEDEFEEEAFEVEIATVQLTEEEPTTEASDEQLAKVKVELDGYYADL